MTCCGGRIRWREDDWRLENLPKPPPPLLEPEPPQEEAKASGGDDDPPSTVRLAGTNSSPGMLERPSGGAHGSPARKPSFFGGGGGGGGGGSDEPGSPGRRLSLMLSPSAPSLGADGRPRSESAARRAIRRVSGMFTSGAGPQRSDSVSDDGGPPCFPGFDPMAPEASRRRGREVSSVFAVEQTTTRFEPRPSHPRRAPRGTRRRRAHRRRGRGGWWWWLAVRSSVLIYPLSPAMGSRSRVA